MNALVTALTKSMLIAPCEDALRRAETQAELETAWFDWCDGFADSSAERRQLQRVYDDCLKAVKRREEAVRNAPRYLGAG